VPHKIRALGVSNITLPNLRRLYAVAEIKPSAVQNRFIAETGYDIPLRRFCRTRGIAYQAFWVLKDKSDVLSSALLEQVATSLGDGIGNELALYLLILGLGTYMKIVNGTEIDSQMKEDLTGLASFKKWMTDQDNRRVWVKYMRRFRDMIGESWGFKR
jgi:diketogulonate reductase-like aldo/keto reductase